MSLQCQKYRLCHFCPGSVCRIIISVKTKTSTDKSAMTPVRLEPAAPQSRVKHSTTEPPLVCLIWCVKVVL